MSISAGQTSYPSAGVAGRCTLRRGLFRIFRVQRRAWFFTSKKPSERADDQRRRRNDGKAIADDDGETGWSTRPRETLFKALLVTSVISCVDFSRHTAMDSLTCSEFNDLGSKWLGIKELPPQLKTRHEPYWMHCLSLARDTSQECV